MKFNKIKVVYSSHLDYSHDSRFENSIKNTIGCKHEIVRYENRNEFSLSEIYNKALTEHSEDNSIFVFCHNDITFDTNKWGMLLLSKFNNTNYDIIGVAGSDILNESGVWWNVRESMYGIVNHQNELRKWTTEFSEPIKGLKDVVTIDGLFIAVNPNGIINKFDEDIKGYHFYDLGFCIPNYLDGCNIGVTTDIRLTHKSIGITNQQWEENRQLFVEKYKEEFPISINEIMIVDSNIKTPLVQPKVSVIIPTKNNYDLIESNIKSWKDNVKYDNYEIIIADTGSDENIKEKYNELQNQLKNKIKVIEYDYYNFAKINNDVVENHIDESSKLLLFCNDDIELKNDVLSEVVNTYNSNINVGTIGIRLHYKDESIQHNGIVGYNFVNKNMYGVTHTDLKLVSNYKTDISVDILGNTAAFLLIERELFLNVNKFNTNYNECFEDVELNLNCILNGKINITDSKAVAIHHESISRGKTKEANDRLMLDYQTNLKPFIDNNIEKLDKYFKVVNN